MKATYRNIALAALALSAVACTQEEDFSTSYLNDPDAVRITVQVGGNDVTGGFTRSNPLGTTEEQTKFNSGDKISVNNVVYTYDGSTEWAPGDGQYLKWETDEMTFTAYYPVGVNDASATTFTVPTEYTTDNPIANADYMTYSGTQTKGDDKSISLTMERKMVRIVIDNISFNDQFATGYSVTGITVHANTKGYANGNPEAGSIAVTAFEQDGDFYALLAPTTADANATFLTVTVTSTTDATDTQDLTVKGIPATTAGNSYNYSLTVGKDMAKIGTVEVNDWTGATITGGEAEELAYTYDAATNTYNVYLSEGVQAAIGEAELTGTTENHATVKLMADVEVAGEPNEYKIVNQDILVDAGVIVLDLNGHTITSSNESWYVIQVGYDGGETTAHATLTIKDSSEDKQGKIIGNGDGYVLTVCSDASHLIVNDGTFEGDRGVEGSYAGSSITINGGTFRATGGTIRPQATTLTITGGTFVGEYALELNSETTLTVTGGSFTGTKYDIDTAGKTGFLSYNEEGTGATFPGGLSIYAVNSYNLNSLLADGAAYYDASGNPLTLADDATSCEGDVTVKKITTTE